MPTFEVLLIILSQVHDLFPVCIQAKRNIAVFQLDHSPSLQFCSQHPCDLIRNDRLEFDAKMATCRIQIDLNVEETHVEFTIEGMRFFKAM